MKFREGNVLKRNSPASSHARFFKISPQTRKISEDARAVLETSKSLIIDNQLSDRAGAHGLRAVTLRNTIMEGRCPTPIGCSRSKYRTTDGSCNNLQNTWWGQTNMPFQRVAVPTYDDGVSKARTRAVDKSELPNVREIVNNALVESDFDDPKYTLSLMQWGQFIDHDIAHTPFPRMPSGEGIECCNPNSVKHPDCFEITIPSSDGFFAPRQQTCMNFVRSMLSLNPQCSMGFAEQMNTLTAFLDGSNIYGSSKEEQDSVRSFNGGMLKTSGNNLLPIDRERGCQAQLRNADCYVAGDSRVNEQPGLAAMHLIWMREHNRVVRELQKITSGWTDEEMFQEARRIVVAEYQHIMYNEYFPITLGTNYMQSFGLSTRTSGFSNDYRPDINPTITNEFATAAFRYGHSLVQGIMDLYSANGAVSTIKLRDHWMSPHLLKQGRVDDIFRSWMQQPSQRFDSFITAEFTNHLFQQPGGNFGLDLMSLNIQRGRDHGIATYNDIRSLCGLRRASTFSDITDQIPKQFVERLQRVYRNVNDIDYFVGGLMEKPVPGSHLGHTFLCIVGDQFARLKKADRYFYDLNGQFSEGQLQEIRRASWARILCDNGDSVTNVQPLAFRLQDNNRNRPVDCNSAQIPKVNLNLWRTERPQSQG
ncbi:unnamed protein product [Meganyctiphanes norvegica]|uniref:Peroxidase n=1 Tax=Meganyctiphanes norvegica TaxID=48144 RepID=A0AAV2PYF2_MEGNR